MRVRTLIFATAFVSTIVGAVAAYLALTVPNDLQAGALLKEARAQIARGDNESARRSLSRIVQQYPRTDAAAAAMVALATIGETERQKLERNLAALRRDYATLQKQVSGMSNRVETIEKKPPPQPVIIREPAPAPKKATATKKAPAKRTPTKKKATKKRK